MKGNNLDMTQGHPTKLLLHFLLPTLASNLLHQVYTITDSVIVGRFLGQRALAAIGVCMPVILLVSAMVIGLNVGVGIVLSQCFGRQDHQGVRRSLANAVYLCLAMGLMAAVVGNGIARPVLVLMGTPAGPMEEAVRYLKISFAATIFPIFYYLLSNAFRGIGDAYTALYCLVISVVGNVVLDYWFVVRLHMGVEGTAYATALAQGASVVFAGAMLYSKYPLLRLRREDFRPEGAIFRQITSLAVPIALQSGFNNLGNVVVQGCVNSFGETIMASYTVGSRLAAFALMPAETIGNALSVYAGQNLGAGKPDRIHRGTRGAMVINAAVCALVTLVLLLLGRPLIRLFLPEATPEVVQAAQRFLWITTGPVVLYGILQIYQQVLRGVGNANASMLGGLMQLGAKVAVALAAAHWLGRLDVLWLAWPISYVAGTLYPWGSYRRWIRKNYKKI